MHFPAREVSVVPAAKSWDRAKLINSEQRVCHASAVDACEYPVPPGLPKTVRDSSPLAPASR
jgi:hypothetical protein